MAPGKGATTAKEAKKQRLAVPNQHEGSQTLQNEAALRSAAAGAAGLELSARVLVASRHGGVDMIAPTPRVGQGAAGPGDSNSSDGADSNAETGAGFQTPRPAPQVHNTVARAKRVGFMQPLGNSAAKRARGEKRPALSKEEDEINRQKAKMDAMTAVHNATAFAQQFIWQHNEERVCPAFDASDAVKLDYQLRLRSDALRAIDFWWGAWPAALHIGFAWMGLAHTTKHEDVSWPNKGRTRWHLVFCAAAIHMETLGRDRTHAFVREVWELTMMQRTVDKRAFDHRTGTASSCSGVFQAERARTTFKLWAPLVGTLDASVPWRVPVETVVDTKVRSNSKTAESRFHTGARAFVKVMFYTGVIDEKFRPWTADDVLGTDRESHDVGPWFPHRNIEMLVRGPGYTCKSKYVPDLEPNQVKFLASERFMLFNPGNSECACL